MGVEKNRKNDAQLRRRRTADKGGKGKANWMLLEAELAQYLIICAAHTGGAVRFGYTRDGGAYALGIYGDGDPYTEYISPTEDINEYIRDLCKDLGGVTGDGSYVGS